MDPVIVQAKVEVRSFTHSWDSSANVKTSVTPWVRPSMSPKVTDFGTNRKRVYEFLLVGNSNLGRISHRFGDSAGFLPCGVTPPLYSITPILGVFPSHQMAHVVGPPHIGPKLFGREIIFEEFQPVITVPKRYRRTDRRTDDMQSQYRALH